MLTASRGVSIRMKTAFVPLTIMVGTGRGASAGVLIKNAEALEVMEKIDTLVVDKTGTLTEGKPGLVSVMPASGKNEDEILRLAASLERGSEHPLAAAIVDGTRERGIKLAEATNFRSVTGKGVMGTVDGKAVGLGNQKLLEEMGVRPYGVVESRRGTAPTTTDLTV